MLYGVKQGRRTMVGRALRQQMHADAEHARLTAALRHQGDMVEVPFEWHTAQRNGMVKFPTYGWVQMTELAWVSATTGKKVPWTSGRTGDQLLISRRIVRTPLDPLPHTRGRQYGV